MGTFKRKSPLTPVEFKYIPYSQMSFHTSQRSSQLENRGYRSFYNRNNDICIYKKSYHFPSTQMLLLSWRMIDRFYFLGGKISESCDNSFVNYGLHYKEVYNLMRQITNGINWPTVRKTEKNTKKQQKQKQKTTTTKKQEQQDNNNNNNNGMIIMLCFLFVSDDVLLDKRLMNL